MSAERGHVFVIAAPSGAGKTSLVAALLERSPRLAVSVSHTTRPARPGETDGLHYHFVDLPTFEAMIADDAFLEHAEVFGNRYGTSVRAVEQLLAGDRDVILEIDWQGARQVKARMPHAITIFILPPSLADLKQRLNKRGQDAPEIIARRLSEARAEIARHAEFDYLVVNDDFDQALEDLAAIMRSARLRGPEQRRRLAALIESLLD